MGLSNSQQAIVMFLVFVLPALITWMALGFPTGREELGILGAALLSGFLAFCKEILGGQAPSASGSRAPPPLTRAARPYHIFNGLKRKLMFLQYLR